MKIAAIAAGLVLSFSAQAQGFYNSQMNIICQDTEFVTKEISKYKEKHVWSSTEESGIVVSLWVNKDTKSYTLTKTSKDGKVTCVISVGSVDENV